MKKNYVSNNVIRRLPRYLRKLDELIASDTERISSGELGRQMGLTPSQIRQDFSCFGEFGQQGYGYNVAALRQEIAHILGMDNDYTGVLVGTGRIGQSLIENFDFNRFGFRLVSAFDIRPELVGTEIAGVPILSSATLTDFVREHGIDMAILSVDRGRAQTITDQLIGAGVKAIWNFTDREVDPGRSGVIIENIHFSDSLLALSYYLSERE